MWESFLNRFPKFSVGISIVGCDSKTTILGMDKPIITWSIPESVMDLNLNDIR